MYSFRAVLPALVAMVFLATAGTSLPGRMNKKTSLTKAEKRMLFLVSAFVVLITLFTIWWHWSNAMPRVTIPSPIMPNPNARDYYLKALRAFVPYQVTTPNGTASFRYWDLRDQVERNDPAFGKGPGITVLTKDGRGQPSLADLQGLSQANAPAFAAFHAGFHYDYREPAFRSFSTPWEGRTRLLTLELYLSVDERTKRMSGDWYGAANDAIDGIRLGVDSPHGALISSLYASQAFQKDGQDSLTQSIDHLNAAQARAVTRRLEQVVHHRITFADALQEEKWGAQAALLEIFHDANWRQKLIHHYDQGYQGYKGFDLAKFYASIYITSKRQILNDYTRYLDAEIAIAKQPYATAVSIPAPPEPKNSIARLSVCNDGKYRWREAASATKNIMLMFEAALHAYRLERGNYPTTLETLLPDYLHFIPSDPFGAGESLHYRRTGQGYGLYSFGPNGKDDHGAADDIVVKKSGMK